MSVGTSARPSRTELTETRILDATGVVLARHGPRSLQFTDIARQANVSRPTLYKYFPSKDVLLAAYGEHEKRRFVDGMASALDGLTEDLRLDGALRYMVEFQCEHPMRGLIAIAPGFVLRQLERNLETMRGPLTRLLEKSFDAEDSPASAREIADLIVRAGMSYLLLPGDDEAFLRQLRHIANRRDLSR